MLLQNTQKTHMLCTNQYRCLPLLDRWKGVIAICAFESGGSWKGRTQQISMLSKSDSLTSDVLTIVCKLSFLPNNCLRLQLQSILARTAIYNLQALHTVLLLLTCRRLHISI